MSRRPQPNIDETDAGRPATARSPRTAAERIAAERIAAERIAAERIAAERIAAERIAAERIAVDELSERAWQLKHRNPEESRALCAEAIARATGIDYDAGRAYGLLARGAVDRVEGEYAAAQSAAEEALAIFQRLKEPRGEARTLSLLGTIQRWFGDPDRSVELQHASIAISIPHNLVREHSGALTALSNALRVLGRYDEALQAARDAYAIASNSECEEEEAFARLAIGSTNEALGNYAEARATYGRVQEIAVKLDNRRLVAYVAGNLSTISYRLGDVVAALHSELECLSIKESLNDKAGIGISLNNIGLFYTDLGDYARALEALVRSLEISQSIGDREGESISLSNIGLLYEALGENGRLLDCYFQSMRIAQSIGNVIGEAYSLSHLGRFHEGTGDRTKALLYYLKSLRVFERCGTQREQAALHRYIGRICVDLGDTAEAARYLAEGLRRSHEMSDVGGEIEALIEMARADRRVNESGHGIPRLKQALALAGTIAAGDNRRRIHVLLAEAYAGIGDDANRRIYERLAAEDTNTAFNETASRRVRELIAHFDGGVARREGRVLGLSEEDIATAELLLRRRTHEPAARVPALASNAPANGGDPRNALETPTPARIRVLTLGTFEVAVSGEALQRANWGRKRARDLFKLLVANHGRWMSADAIFEALWSTDEERRANLLVRNAIAHVRRALATHDPDGVAIRCVDGAYMLDLGPDAWIDFLKFKEHVVAARGASTAEERRRGYTAAVELYGGEFLAEDTHQEWMSFERHVLQDAFLEALEFLAREHLRIGNDDEAIECARRIIQRDEISETAYEVLLTAQRSRGRIADMHRSYQECERAYQRELGTTPPRHLAAITADGGA